MSWDRSWTFAHKALSIEDVEEHTTKILAKYNKISVVIEKEANDCITCFFSISKEETEETDVIEISFYHMGGKNYVISLEGGSSDNAKQPLADNIAEDLAESFDAEPLEE